MKIAEYIYEKAPRILQSFLITCYGAYQTNKRLGRNLSTITQHIIASEGLPVEILRSKQNEKLRALLTYAQLHTPYCRDMLKQAGASPHEVTTSSLKDIFPILEKRHIIDNQDYFFSKDLDAKFETLSTSGTSGTPLRILCDQDSRRENYSYYCWLLGLWGIRYRDRSITFAGRNLFSKTEKNVFWRADHFNNTLYCSSYRLREENLLNYIRAMEEWSPLFIDSYPSAISVVAEFICRNKIAHKIRPKLVLTSSETLTDTQYAFIKQAFQCSILDQYGCTEMATMAYRIDDGPYEVPPLYSLLEIHNPNAIHDSGELLCTGLINKGLPLIRYRIGDQVSGYVSNALSPHIERFESIVGRLDDLILTPEGNKIGRLDPAFKGVEGIKEAQIVQTSLNVLIVKASLLNFANVRSIEDRLTANLKMRTSPQMNIIFDYSSPIERLPNGKFRSVISKLGQTIQ